MPGTFRCELTPERLDAGERELAAALALWTLRAQDALRARRERLEPVLRWSGLALSAAGALLSGWAVTRYATSTCPAAAARSSGAFYQVMTPVFVVLGVLFWFLPRVTAELRAWAPGATARAAPRALAPIRAALPSAVTYEITGEGIRSTLTRPPRQRTTAFRSVRGAVSGTGTICLFGPPPFSRLLRVVWVPDAGARGVVLAALAAAQVPVVPLASAGTAEASARGGPRGTAGALSPP